MRYYNHSATYRLLSTIALLLISGVALAIGAHKTFHGASMWITYITAFVSWWGYLIAHKITTGKFVHNPTICSGQASSSFELDNWLLVVGGVSILSGGMVTGAIGIRVETLSVTIVGGVMFITGYVIAHIGSTNKLL